MRYRKPLTLFHDLLKSNAVERGRLLGLDVGDKYVGLAVSDPCNKIASPLSVLLRKKSTIDLMVSDFESLVSELSLEGFVVGYPFDRFRGTRDVLQVNLFIDDLCKTRKLEGLKYTYWDERFTSKVKSMEMQSDWLRHQRSGWTITHCMSARNQDGLLDVTRGSTDITVSNNWFKNQDKVMLLGHDDGYLRDKNMKVTVVYNHFGPNCNQRMPRIRHGYAHVANNLYQGWMQYAIGGSTSPRVKSDANLFIAPESGKKEITWRKISSHGERSSCRFYSVGDVFENGASFVQSDAVGAEPRYNSEQVFKAADARFVRSLTASSGALRCTQRSRC